MIKVGLNVGVIFREIGKLEIVFIFSILPLMVTFFYSLFGTKQIFI